MSLCCCPLLYVFFNKKTANDGLEWNFAPTRECLTAAEIAWMDEEKSDVPSGESLIIQNPTHSRTNSFLSDDLYMSVCESPIPTDLDPECDFLSLNSRHVSSDPDNSFLSTNESFTHNEPLWSDDHQNILAEIKEDPFLCQFSHLCLPPKLPKLIDSLPKWNNFQDDIRRLRKKDLEQSKNLEESNMGIYGTDLALRVIEEVRWYNEVSKDPILSRLVNEMDPEFPLAMHKPSTAGEELNALTRSDSRTSSFSIELPTSARAEEERIKSIYKGVDEFVLRRKLDPTWHLVAANSISKAFLRSPIRDPRVVLWVQDLVSNFEQALSLPLSTLNSSEMMVGETIVHLRGTSTWAPPRDAWIFTPITIKDPKILLEKQNYKCAGCELKIENEYIKRVRLCEYYGKMFCHGCHNNNKSIIPAKIMKSWNFSEAPVSDRALRFLTDAKDQACIHLSSFDPVLISKVAPLRKTILLREKIIHMFEYVRHCNLADEVVTGHGNLSTLFNSLEQHMRKTKDVFSLSDLTRVHNKDLLNHLEPLVFYAKNHIEKCKDCRNRAFVCWVCGDATDLLFPFQMDRVHRCDECGSLAHNICAENRMRIRGKLECSKCERCEKQRQDRQRITSISET